MKKLSFVATLLAILTVLTIVPVAAFGTGTVINPDDYPNDFFVDSSFDIDDFIGDDFEVTMIDPDDINSDFDFDFGDEDDGYVYEESKPVDTSSDFASGSGYDDDPYIIKTQEQLLKIGKATYRYDSFKLANDIKLTATDWIPIDTFSGVLDGAGHKITNLVSTYGGLFDRLQNAKVMNLGIEASLDVDYVDHVVGGLAQEAETSKITNCYVSGTVKARNDSAVGGIVGAADAGSEIVDCMNKASLSAGKVGGIVYSLYSANIIRCVNVGTVNATESAGALIHGGNNATVDNCYYLIGSAKVGTTDVLGISNYDEDPVGSFGITSAQMKDKASFASFDFEKTWTMSGDGISLSIDKKESASSDDDDDSPRKKKKNDIDWLLIGLIAGGSLLLIVIIVVVIIIVVKSKKKKKAKNAAEAVAALAVEPVAAPVAEPVAPVAEPVVAPEPEIATPAVEEAPTVEESPVVEPVAPVEEPIVAPVVEPVVEAKPTPKFCSQCGTPVAAGSKFCGNCGNKLV